MDARNRWMNNIFIERQWKTVKYEDLYLKAYQSLRHAKKSLQVLLTDIIQNTRRPHQGLNDRTLDEVYYESLPDLKQAV